MAFVQFSLVQSINQTRGIFDKYIYDTVDTMAQVQTSAYFSFSRFKDSDAVSRDWIGALIECECCDGIFIGQIQSDAETVVNVGADGGFAPTKEVTVDGGTYTVDGTEARIWALSSPTISFPGANTVVFPNIPIRTLSGTTTLAALAGTIEVTSVANGTSVVMGQRSATNEWLQII